jgi:hypothetical protein
MPPSALTDLAAPEADDRGGTRRVIGEGGNMISKIGSLVLGCYLAFTGCASSTSHAVPRPSAGQGDKKPIWSVATEQETAAALDRKFQNAAKGYVKLKKDGVLLFCKRAKEIGSNLPTIQCITESQLRNQVETMDDYRERRRHAAKCTHGVGCGGG